jgi:hypothetical protein
MNQTTKTISLVLISSALVFVGWGCPLAHEHDDKAHHANSSTPHYHGGHSWSPWFWYSGYGGGYGYGGGGGGRVSSPGGSSTSPGGVSSRGGFGSTGGSVGVSGIS